MKKGFTLIELLAVIVILAIIALIAAPIILGIINDAKEDSEKRSIENYAHAVELAVARYAAGKDGVIPVGTYKTDDYLLLNSVFNPKASKSPLKATDLFKIDSMRNLYENLSPKDKERMGWTKDFDKNVPNVWMRLKRKF